MLRNVFYRHKGLEIKIIDLLTIDLCATAFPLVILLLSWVEFYPQYPRQPEGPRAKQLVTNWIISYYAPKDP